MSNTLHKTRLWAMFALVATMLVAMGLSFTMYAQAYADEGDVESVTVALTIVDDSDDTVVYNGKVLGLTTENTVSDLLAAAGFTEVDAYDGDRYTYVSNYGSCYFLGKEYNAETWEYWATMFDGSGDNWESAMLTSQLQSDGHYQYIYTNANEFSYSQNIPDPLTTDLTENQVLLNNLADRFGKGGADSSIYNSTYGAALALASMDMSDRIDVDAIKANIKDEDGSGTLAKYILALDAAGEDVTDLIATMEEREDANTASFYNFVIMLAAYEAEGVQPSDSAMYSRNDMIQVILDDQSESGLFPKEYSGAQETAEAIFALNPYKSDSEAPEGVSAAITAACGAVEGLINPETGVIAPSIWSQALMDYDAMGELIHAFIECDQETYSKQVAALVMGLVNGADDTLDGYKADENIWAEDMAAADAFRGLAAAFANDSNRLYLNNVVDMRQDIADAEVSASSKKYTGKAFNPVPTVTLDGAELVEGTDFTVSYTDANYAGIDASEVVNVGTYFVKITGMGAYTGEAYGDLTITKVKVTEATAEKIANKKYDGKKYNPVPVLTYKGVELVKGTDFKLAYTDKDKNVIKAKKVKAVGTYYAKVTGKGNFKGTEYIKFKITKK